MQQEFRFDYQSLQQVQAFLDSLASAAQMDRRAEDFYVFTAAPGDPGFSFDAEIVPQGLRSVRSGEYFGFFGLFVEGLTGTFGPVTIEDDGPA
jgi:hypothetical protein